MQCPFAAAEAGTKQGQHLPLTSTIFVSPSPSPSSLESAAPHLAAAPPLFRRLMLLLLLPAAAPTACTTSSPAATLSLILPVDRRRTHCTSRHRPTRIRSQPSFNTPASLPTAPACRHRRTGASSLVPPPEPPQAGRQSASRGSCHKATHYPSWRHRRSHAWNRTSDLFADRCIAAFLHLALRVCAGLPIRSCLACLVPPSRGQAPAWLPVAVRYSQFSITDTQIDAED